MCTKTKTKGVRRTGKHSVKVVNRFIARRINNFHGRYVGISNTSVLNIKYIVLYGMIDHIKKKLHTVDCSIDDDTMQLRRKKITRRTYTVKVHIKNHHFPISLTSAMNPPQLSLPYSSYFLLHSLWWNYLTLRLINQHVIFQFHNVDKFKVAALRESTMRLKKVLFVDHQSDANFRSR